MAGVGVRFTGPHSPVRDAAMVAGLRSETASERKMRKILRDSASRVVGYRRGESSSPAWSRLARFRSPVERRTLVDRHGLRVSHSAESEIAQSGAHLLPRIPQLFVTRPAGRFLDYVGRASVGQAGRRDLEFQLAGRTCSAVVADAKSFAAIEQWVRDAAQDTLARLGARTVSVFGVRVRRVGRRSAGSFRVPAPAAWPIRWEASRTGAGRWPWTVRAPAARAMAPPQRPDRHPAAGSGQDERNHLPRHLVGALRPDRGHRDRRRPAHPAR